MKKRSKGCLITLAVIVVVLVGIRIALDLYVGKIVNQQLALRLESEASVGSVDIAILQGRVAIKDLVIKEPLEGEQENLISLGELSVKVSLRSLLSDTIEIQRVTLKDTHINIVTPSTNLYNFMMIFPSDTNTVNAAIEDVNQIVTNAIDVVDDEMDKASKSILIKRIQFDNLTITYKDYNICDPALFVGLRNINANIRNLTLNGEPDGKLHSSVDLTCEMMQKEHTGYLGVWAETAIIGTGAGIPAVNAIVAINGLNLDDYEQIIPLGLTTSLGGNVLDIRVDASVEQEYLWIKAKTKTVSGKFEVTVDGTPANPSMSMTDILTTLGMRGLMSLANPLVNVGDASLKVGKATVDTSMAVVSGAGKAVGNIGKGLFNTVKSTAQGDFKDAGSHLVNTGTGTIGDVLVTVTNTTGTATSGVIKSGGALINKNSIKKWQTGVESRKDNIWKKAPEDLEKMSYPKKVE
jgi:hypothetical protein